MRKVCSSPGEVPGTFMGMSFEREKEEQKVFLSPPPTSPPSAQNTRPEDAAGVGRMSHVSKVPCYTGAMSF